MSEEVKLKSFMSGLVQDVHVKWKDMVAQRRYDLFSLFYDLESTTNSY